MVRDAILMEMKHFTRNDDSSTTEEVRASFRSRLSRFRNHFCGKDDRERKKDKKITFV